MALDGFFFPEIHWFLHFFFPELSKNLTDKPTAIYCLVLYDFKLSDTPDILLKNKISPWDLQLASAVARHAVI